MKIQKKIFNGFFQFGMLKYIIKWKIWSIIIHNYMREQMNAINTRLTLHNGLIYAWLILKKYKMNNLI